MDPREEQRAWLLKVLEQTKLAPTALAIKSNLAPTTLTRFINNPEHATALSARTISAVENATGLRYGTDPKLLGVREGEAVEFIGADKDDPAGAIVAEIKAKHRELVPWVLKSRALESAGYLPGDVLFVDPARARERGDIVCVQVIDWGRGDAETVFRIWEEPYLLAMTSDRAQWRPLLYPSDNLEIRGVVVGSFRPRKTRSAA